MKTIAPPRLSLAVPLVLILAACAATPPEAPVKIALPASYAQAQSGWEPAQAMAAAPRGAWWSVFDDPVLNDLETQVAQHNQSLAAQLAAYEQAQAAVAQAQAAYYPAVTAGASANRARTAGTGAVGNSLSDAQAAHAAGCVPHLVLTGRHAPQADAPLPPDYPAATRVHADLAAFATAFIAE